MNIMGPLMALNRAPNSIVPHAGHTIFSTSPPHRDTRHAACARCPHGSTSSSGHSIPTPHAPQTLIYFMSNDGGRECAICLDPIGDAEHRLPCAHVFHPWCILRAWRDDARDMSCPLCRRTTHRRMVLSVGNMQRSLERHRAFTRVMVDFWLIVGWVVALGCAFWVCTAVFGEFGALDVGAQYLFSALSIVLIGAMRPAGMPYPVLALGAAE